MNNGMMALTMQKLAEQKVKEAVAKQLKIDDEAQQNCLNAINQVQSQIVHEDDQSFDLVKDYPELENDQQTRRFFDFVRIASNFSSLKFADRLRHVPELINSIKQFITEMIKEIKEFADIARELQDLIHYFIKLVVNTKRNMELVISPLERSIEHMEVIADALSPDSTKPLAARDKEDIEIALHGMSSGIQKLLDLARTSKKESSDLDEKISTMKGNILKKKIVVEGRLKLIECAPWVGIGGGAFVGGAAVAAIVEANILGGVGTLVIAGMTLTPVYAIIAAAVIGGVFLGSIVYLVEKLWEKHNTKALEYLNKILGLLMKLSDDNLSFSNSMNKTEVRASKILNETDEIKRTITSGSERYRKINVRLCNEAIQSTKAVIKCIDEIIRIDMSEWMNSSSVLTYASTLKSVTN